MPARVLQLEALRALTIMLAVERSMEKVKFMSNLPNNQFSESFFFM